MKSTLNTIEILMAEHRQIERVMSAMEACARRVELGEPVAPAEVGRFARFLSGYADELHHGKEETLLFEKMVEAGFPREAGPIGMMCHEHARGRELVRALAALGQKASWEPAERKAVVESALEFASLLRGHIQKEDRILYPMAEQRLSEAAMEQLAQGFRTHLDQHATGEQELLDLAHSLETAWIHRNEPAPAPAPVSCTCGKH